ncbi:MAG: biotin/lipoyl-binding protein [Bacteroidales bacterium]|nr:biotin/lipoyl-binding protein [Bacteroidales bacterium]MBR5531971.1 biotin/lipoyl-binding protein [Bacteroidales bacterium]
MKEYKYKINGNPYTVTIGDINDNIAHVEVNGTSYTVELEKAPVVAAKPVVVKQAVAPTKPAAQTTVVNKPAAATGGKSGVKSPLPGVILDIKVNVGDTVKKGQTIIILEAMKMENNINADKDGTVTAISVNKGDSVLEGSVLVTIE